MVKMRTIVGTTMLVCSLGAGGCGKSNMVQQSDHVGNTSLGKKNAFSSEALMDGNGNLNTIKCSPAGGLQKGTELRFGVISRAMYSLKVTDVGEKTIIADVTMPAWIERGTSLLSLSLTFRGIELPRLQVGPLAAEICDNLRFIRIGSPGIQGVSEINAKRSVQVVKGLRKLDIHEYFLRFGNSMAEKGFEVELGRVLRSLMSMRSHGMFEDGNSIDFTIEGSNEKEFILRVGYQTFRLDREFEAAVEFVLDKAGHFTMPLRLESLSVEKGSKAAATVKFDCTRDIEMEIFMSEHASGKHPDCK